MKLFLRSSALFLAAMTLALHAEVYRCQESDKLTYTDRPCSTDARPAVLPWLTMVDAERHPADLAKQYDRDAAAADARARKRYIVSSNDGVYLEAISGVSGAVLDSFGVVGIGRGYVESFPKERNRIDNKNEIRACRTYINCRESRRVAFRNGLLTPDASRTASWRGRR